MRNRVVIEILERLICEIKICDDNEPYMAYVKSVIGELKEEETDEIVNKRIKQFNLENIV